MTPSRGPHREPATAGPPPRLADLERRYWRLVGELLARPAPRASSPDRGDLAPLAAHRRAAQQTLIAQVAHAARDVLAARAMAR